MGTWPRTCSPRGFPSCTRISTLIPNNSVCLGFYSLLIWIPRRIRKCSEPFKTVSVAFHQVPEVQYSSVFFNQSVKDHLINVHMWIEKVTQKFAASSEKFLFPTWLSMDGYTFLVESPPSVLWSYVSWSISELHLIWTEYLHVIRFVESRNPSLKVRSPQLQTQLWRRVNCLYLGLLTWERGIVIPALPYLWRVFSGSTRNGFENYKTLHKYKVVSSITEEYWLRVCVILQNSQNPLETMLWNFYLYNSSQNSKEISFLIGGKYLSNWSVWAHVYRNYTELHWNPYW